MSERTWRVLEIMHAARDHLNEKGIENAHGNAEALLGKALGLPQIQLYLQHERPLTDDEIRRFRAYVRRRLQHEPLQLILGTVEFHGVTIEIAPGLLIPRSETEELAERVTHWIQSEFRGNESLVLDLGTGTGCLAVAIAARCPPSIVDAVDVDFEAVRCTERNARANGVDQRVRAVLADMTSPRFLKIIRPPYDVVVGNPPYIAEPDLTSLPLEIREHESRHALNGGADGLTFYRRIAELVPNLLKPRGLLALEIGDGQCDAILTILRDVMRVRECHHDMAGIPRVLFCRRESG